MQAPTPPPAITWHGLPADIWLGMVTILAIILGPVFAVQVDKVLQKRREKRARKISIFRELMITRSTRLSARHVEALNGLQLEFSENASNEKGVVVAWHSYMHHLNHPPTDGEFPPWVARGSILLTDLLYEMSVCLQYPFTKLQIETESYIPKYFVDTEQEQNELRKAALEVFKGDKPLKVEYREQPQPPPRMVPR